VDIPKPQGGIRTLGIPTLTDRLIQQALYQVLSPIFEADFSEHSYGFVRLRRILRYAQDQPSAVLRPSGWSTGEKRPSGGQGRAAVCCRWPSDRGGQWRQLHEPGLPEVLF